MALARIQYESDGSTDTYSLPFPYIAREDIEVSLDGTQTTAFSFLDGSTIKLDTVPAQGVIIDIVRRTEQNYLLVEFNDGSTLLESDLTLAAQQTFFMSQESLDQTGSTLTVANDGSYSASSRRISSLGYPTGADDASTKQYVDDIFAQGEDAFEQAVIATDAADTAVGARDAAQLAEATTLNYRNTAEQHKIDAAASSAAASTSEANAAASEASADAHQTEAGNWANLAEDTLVPEGDQVDDYSALHWARKAEGWAAGVNLPSATGNGGQLIRQAADESGFEYMTPATARTAISVYSTNEVYTQTESDDKYAQLSGGAAADFASMPLVAGDLVVESGSNSDGEWVRWADGTQITRKHVLGVASTSESGVFGTTSGTTWRMTVQNTPLPMVFINPPEVVGSGGYSTESTNTRDILAFAVSESVFSYSLRGSTTNGQNVAGGFVATGRWK